MTRSTQHDHAALAATVTRQYQVISRSQVMAHGMTTSALHQRLRTLARDARMAARGITVLHFTPRQIRTQPGTVVSAIRSALAAASSRPRLPIRTITTSSEALKRPGKRDETPVPVRSHALEPGFHDERHPEAYAPELSREA
jgi:hypothetical protein